MTDSRLIELTADIVSAHVSNNDMPAGDVPELIRSVFMALTNAQRPVAAEPIKAEPAVAVRSSIKQDYIVCLEDGKKLKMLKRYLRTNYNTTPDEYRAKWNLPHDYPMVAPAYAEHRRDLAKAVELGRKKLGNVGVTVGESAGTTAPAVEGAIASAPQKRGRPAKVKPVSEAADA